LAKERVVWSKGVLVVPPVVTDMIRCLKVRPCVIN
jgi:hypothetical protein